MTGYLIDYGGAAYELPRLLSWDISHGFGLPCDAFEICLVFDMSVMEILPGAIRFKAVFEDMTVFYGVVDEYEAECSTAGLILTVRGRGLAALLLDNEAEAAEYYNAGLQFILDRHVIPFGVTQIDSEPIANKNVFSVGSGSSQWKVLEDFVWFGAGIRPRFSRDGTLIIRNKAGDYREIGDATAVSGLRFKESRYGVISSVVVKNRVWGVSSTVENTEFIMRGGSCRRVVNVPRHTYFDAMRHTGQYQIDRSMQERVVCELTLPSLFSAFPGDSIELRQKKIGLEGEFVVGESRCRAGAAGGETTLRLFLKNA